MPLATRAASRAFWFLVTFAYLCLLFVLWYGVQFYEKQIPLALYSALVLLCFSTLVTESYFTKPNDAIANTTSLLVMLVPLSTFIHSHKIFYYSLIIVALLALFFAIGSNALFDPSVSPSNIRQRISTGLKQVAVRLGSGRLLFGATGAYLLLLEGQKPNAYTACALALLFIFLVFDVAALSDALRRPSKVRISSGKIVGVQGDNLAIGTAVAGRPQIGQTAKLSIGDSLFWGRVVAHHQLHDEGRTAFSLRGKATPDEASPPAGEFLIAEDELQGSPPVGLVNARTNVPTLRFRQMPNCELRIGHIVSCQVGGDIIYYQIQDASLIEDKVNSNDATDYVEVTAAQIGRWNTDTGSFERFTWLPRIYSDVTVPKEYPSPEAAPNELQIGKIPGTNVPVFLNAEEAVTHHTAVLGVTGVGKSVFVRDLIQRLAGPTTKFICVDLTREYVGKFQQTGGLLISNERSKFLASRVNDLGKELSKFRSQQNETVLNTLRTDIVAEFRAAITEFVESPDKQIGILELADLDGSLENLEYLRWFFRSVFLYARQREVKSPRICLVLEEAHTIVPEWNFIGSDDRSAGNVVNSIAQVALQGRKYGVGLVVVAQRTASVSKTVLTQCNTVIAFQQFDKTSFDFLESFVGGDAARVLPNLRPRTAIATGKAIRSTTPLIFEVPELTA